jgi:hypothetical protein
MWAVCPVTAGARAPESEVCVVEVAGRRNESANSRVGDVVGPVARAALDLLVPAHELKSGAVVIEATGVEPDGVKVAPEVIAVARAAVAREAGVQPPAGRNASAQGRVAVQALSRIDSALADAVAARALSDSLQPGVRRGQRARREELSVDGRGRDDRRGQD